LQALSLLTISSGPVLKWISLYKDIALQVPTDILHLNQIMSKKWVNVNEYSLRIEVFQRMETSFDTGRSHRQLRFLKIAHFTYESALP
jgi:hypothetical protein